MRAELLRWWYARSLCPPSSSSHDIGQALPTAWTLCGSRRIARGEASTTSHESIPEAGAKTHAVGSVGLCAVRLVPSEKASCEVRHHSQTLELHPVSPSPGALQVSVAVFFWKA